MAKRAADKLKHKELLREIAKLRTAEQTATFGDGGGLALVVTKAGKARFVHRYRWQNRTVERWLPGEFPELGLSEAREMRDADRKLLRDGINPIMAARAAAETARGVPTFAAYAKAHVAFLAPNGPRARLSWLRQMTGEDTTGETVGMLASMLIDDIRLEHVKMVIAPLWLAKPATAKELCGRIRRVLDHRQVNARPDDERANPADFGRIQRALGQRYRHRNEPRAALPWREVPSLLARLATQPQIDARAAEFAIATGCRIGEALGARWGEIDLRARTWTIPKERLGKTGEAHVVPLTIAMMKVLRQVRPMDRRRDPGDLIFPNSKGTRCHAKDVLVRVKSAANDPAVTTHGFRSALVGWGTAIPHPHGHGAVAPYSRDLMDVCLAHQIGSEVSQSYLRDRWLERRRVVMAEWSRFCLSPAAEVIPFRRAA
jgi:integrase